MGKSDGKKNFKQTGEREGGIPPFTVKFVPNSNKGMLLKKLEQIEPQFECLSGYKTRFVESAGTQL